MSRFKGKKVHLVGIGGVGMSGLAKLLDRQGYMVSGSDMEDSAVTKKLSEQGIQISIGHFTENITADIDRIVVSAAIKANNPELKRALELNRPVYKYSEMLGEVMRGFRAVAISGTHGKSTTSGWLSHLLSIAGANPNFIVGAEVSQLGSNSNAGKGEIFVAEACEYDRSFLQLEPDIAVILNIEADHLDYYSDVKEIAETFCEFGKKAGPEGIVIINGMDENIRSIEDELRDNSKVVTFGIGREFDFSADNLSISKGCYEFDIFSSGNFVCRTRVSIPGIHNVMNGLAVFASAVEAGISETTAAELLGEFTGIDRRIMLKSEQTGVTVLDDYAHHPTEIRASLKAVRQMYEPNRLFCVFQPHQYSRTRFLLEDFAQSFALADITIMPEIYFVRDTAEAKEQVNSEKLAERIRQYNSKAFFINGFDKITDFLVENVRAGDAVVTMGAGDIWKVSDEYIRRIGNNSKKEHSIN